MLIRASILLAVSAPAQTLVQSEARTPVVANIRSEMDRRMPIIVREEHIGGIGVVVIRDGKVFWTGHYGQQSAGVPITGATAFNTASIAKTVTAETLLALAAARRIDLDEPIGPFVKSPGLDADPRFRHLTTRILLSHRSGLRNWPDDYPDGKLAFEASPGARYGYSGAGVELAARYAEAKTGKRLRDLTAEMLLRPWRIDGMAIGELPAWSNGHLALPVDAEGNWLEIAKIYPGLQQGTGLGAAYDLITTTGAYGTFLERLIASSNRSPRSRTVREKILTPLAGDERYGCEPDITRRCPERYGYAFGWQVHQYGSHRVLQHTGNDEGQTDLVYFSPDRRTGAAIFVNGANGSAAIVRALEIIGDEPEITEYYRGLIEKLLNRRLPVLASTARSGDN